MRMLAIAALAAAACTSPARHTSVGDAVLPDARAVADVPEGGTTVVVDSGDAALPDEAAAPLKLAVDRGVPWSHVDALLSERPDAILLVGHQREARAFSLSDPLDPTREAISLVITHDHKACVSRPGIKEAKCVRAAHRAHIDRAFVRELVREAVRGYGLTDVEVEVPAHVPWSDVVAAVDGARTCCQRSVRVALER
jgi:hypothetical protein